MSDAVFNGATSNFSDAVILGGSYRNVFAEFDLNHEVHYSLTSLLQKLPILPQWIAFFNI